MLLKIVVVSDARIDNNELADDCWERAVAGRYGGAGGSIGAADS